MRKTMRSLFAVVLLSVLALGVKAQTLAVGDPFPLDRLETNRQSVDNTLVVFIPSLTGRSYYAGMLIHGFYNYFDQGMAFDGLKKRPSTRIVLITGDEPTEQINAQDLLGSIKVIFDPSGKIFSAFGMIRPQDKNADATVFLLDSNGAISLIDRNYRAQGEHLKPLETKLKQQSGIDTVVKATPGTIRVGDTAPDFSVNGKQRLSDLRGEVILISFYPAAFSGNSQGEIAQEAGSYDMKSMSCIAQISSLDRIQIVLKDPKRILISSSTDSLLEKWKKYLGTFHIDYVNDPDYSVSTRYGSYNNKGFNNRVSVIVDQEGKIAYIDESFESGDEEVLNAKMDKLLRRDER